MPVPTMESSGQGPSSGRPPGAAERIFRYAPAARVLDGVGAVFFLLVAALPLLLGRPLSGSWPLDGVGMALAVLLALACLRALPATGDVYVVQERGIARRGRGKGRAVGWEEVAEVRAPAGMSRRLELLDAGGELLLAIPCDLEGFDSLQRLVLERSGTFRDAGRRSDFAGVVGQRGALVAAVAVAGLGAWCASRGALPLAWGSWAAAALMLVVWACAFTRLHLDAEGVTLQALLRRRRIEWSQVVSVRLVHAAGRDGSARRQVVRLERADGAPVDLPPVPGVLQLHESVLKAWQEARGAEWAWEEASAPGAASSPDLAAIPGAAQC